MNLKKLIEQVDLEAMLTEACRATDVAIISPIGCESIFVLNASEVAALKELFAGAKVMLELNSIIHESLQGVFA